jgi:hypothetical protein
MEIKKLNNLDNKWFIKFGAASFASEELALPVNP